MNKKIILYLSVFGLIGLLYSCEKDETKVVFPADPIKPSIVTFPNLTLDKARENDTIAFIGSPADVGFVASGKYILEACVPGNDFKSVTQIFNGTQDTLMTTTIKSLNTKLKSKFPAGSALPMDMRLRFQLTVASGSGSLGSLQNPLQVISETMTVNISTY